MRHGFGQFGPGMDKKEDCMKSRVTPKKKKTGASIIERLSSRSKAGLENLDRLVGTWDLSGEVRGRIRYERMEGGFFLIQHVDKLLYAGRTIKGIEIIGRQHLMGKEPSREIRSRFVTTQLFDPVFRRILGGVFII
jgi:hypothetical protein